MWITRIDLSQASCGEHRTGEQHAVDDVHGSIDPRTRKTDRRYRETVKRDVPVFDELVSRTILYRCLFRAERQIEGFNPVNFRLIDLSQRVESCHVVCLGPCNQYQFWIDFVLEKDFQQIRVHTPRIDNDTTLTRVGGYHVGIRETFERQM
ncbi:MAG: hypothetical protein EA383_09005 [Spirochaetaceae bacterium]|nr:MAG: hypothetical protein EA383_09005 [Spirochaetaceae bacterium]